MPEARSITPSPFAPTDLLFLDLEYISNGQHIAELSLVALENDQPVVVFHERVNPFGEPEFIINRYARNVCKLPLESLASAKPFVEWAPTLNDLITGKTIVHWGGNDVAILRRAFDRCGHAFADVTAYNLLSECRGNLFVNFAEAFPSIVEELRLTETLHCARADAFMLACIYAKMKFENFSLHATNSGLARFVEEKRADVGIFRRETQAKPAASTGPLAPKRLKIYLTGFQENKGALGKRFAALGIAITSSANVRSLDYLVIPHAGYTSSSVERFRERTPARILTLAQLEALISHTLDNQAS